MVIVMTINHVGCTETIIIISEMFGVSFYLYLSRKVWLSTEGSPKSTITNCEFSNEKDINKLEFSDFKIVRESKPKKIR